MDENRKRIRERSFYKEVWHTNTSATLASK